MTSVKMNREKKHVKFAQCNLMTLKYVTDINFKPFKQGKFGTALYLVFKEQFFDRYSTEVSQPIERNLDVPILQLQCRRPGGHGHGQ